MSEEFGYSIDLANIHDLGFGEHSIKASKKILTILKDKEILDGKIVELGCGSGILAKILFNEGYEIYGIDISSEMIRLSKEKLLKGTFIKDSIWHTIIPPCEAVLSIGEVLNYEFDGDITYSQVKGLLKKIYTSLSLKGVFIFDILCQEEPINEGVVKNFTEGEGWFVAVERTETCQRLIRRIISFRKHQGCYRKTIENHNVKKFDKDQIKQILSELGFKVKVLSSYGDYSLRQGHLVFIAEK